MTRRRLVLYITHWMLRKCWIRTDWKYKSTQCSISCHPYRNIRNKFDHVINMVKVNPGSSFFKKPRGMDIQLPGTSFGSILKLLLFSSFCTSSRKIPFASLFYMIFCFISYMYITPQGKKRQTLGTIVLIQAERSYHFDHGCMFQKIALPSVFVHIFPEFIQVHSPRAGVDNPLGQTFVVHNKTSSPLVICCKFKKNLYNLWLYTHLFMI